MREITMETRVAIEQLISELLWRLDHGKADTTWERTPRENYRRRWTTHHWWHSAGMGG
jgi:hypothetical protein